MIKINGITKIGKDYKPYLIAEIGTNHNQKLNTAKELIIKAAEAGFDCVKFQTYEPEEIVSSVVSAKDYGLDKLYGDISAKKMFSKYLKTPKNWFPELNNFCKEYNIDCATTIHGSHGLEWSKKIGFDIIKVASMDHNNIPFLESLVNVVKSPILISFGMANLDDIELALETLSAHKYGVGMFHCVSIYPPNPEEFRLTNIRYFLKNFKIPVGFSDHSDDTITSVAAFALGSSFFEKHITLDKNSLGPDHPFAINADQMKSYVEGINLIASGNNSKQFIPPTKREEENRDSYLKSLVATKDFNSGDLIKKNNISLVRPGTGIPPKYLNEVLGKHIARPVSKGSPITWDDIEK